MLVTLKPLNTGPIVLIATHYIEGGLHTAKAKQKTYHTKLDFLQQFERMSSNPHLFFNSTKPNTDKDDEIKDLAPYKMVGKCKP